MTVAPVSSPYAALGRDPVRAQLEVPRFAELVPALLRRPGAGRVLDLGCADGLAARLARGRIAAYTGVDSAPRHPAFHGRYVRHDLRDGLGPVGDEPFDVYLALFGVVSHLLPVELDRLLAQIARHARPGALVAIEALGLYSLEWPGLWSSRPGAARVVPYRLAADVEVHPWSPVELGARLEREGIRVRRFADRSIQAGPKVGEGRYWPGLPPLRRALSGLLQGDDRDRLALERPLGPLPDHPAARLHHALAARRRALVADQRGTPEESARAVWSLDPPSGGGFGHGLLVVGQVA